MIEASTPGTLRAWWIAAFCAGVGQQVFVVLRNPFVIELGGNAATVGLVQAAGGAAGIAAGLLGLWALRRVSSRVALTSSLAANALGFAIQIAARTPSLAFLGSAVAGLGIQGLTMSAAPFLARQATAESRVRTFAVHALLIQGIPGAIGAALGGRIHDFAASRFGPGLMASRAALTVGLITVGIAIVPALTIREPAQPRHSGSMFRLERPRLAVALLACDVVAFLANGLSVPFLQLYLARTVGLSATAVGGVYAAGLAAGVLGHVFASPLASRFGTARTLVAAQLGVAVLFIVLMTSRDPRIVAVAFAMRFVAASATVPLYASLLHGAVPLRDSGPVASYRMVAQSIAWAAANAAFGLLATIGGFSLVLGASAATHVAGAVLGALVYRRLPVVRDGPG